MERRPTNPSIAVWAADSPFLPALLDRLQGSEAAYVVLPDAPEDAQWRQAAPARALVVGRPAITGSDLDRFGALELVVRCGVGVDRVDLDAATERGVIVTNVADYGRHEVADHALTLLLAVTRRLVPFSAQAGGDWLAVDHPPVPRLQGRRIGIVGLGRIGTAMAARAGALGMEVVAHDPYLEPASFAAVGVTSVTLEELLATSDVISLHAPFTTQTRHLLDDSAFALMTRAPVVVNTARGELIDTGALERALESGQVAAAGLDVLEGEPDGGRHATLLARENVLVTPHVAWYSLGSKDQLGSTAAQLALDFVQHGTQPTVLNPAVLGAPHTSAPRPEVTT